MENFQIVTTGVPSAASRYVANVLSDEIDTGVPSTLYDDTTRAEAVSTICSTVSNRSQNPSFVRALNGICLQS